MPSSVRYLAYEEEMISAFLPSEASGSSLSAARSVLQEYHVVDRADSIALHERVMEETRPASEKKGQEWPCDGPGCGTMMRNKSEWQKYFKKFYCKRCYATNNVVQHAG